MFHFNVSNNNHLNNTFISTLIMVYGLKVLVTYIDTKLILFHENEDSFSIPYIPMSNAFDIDNIYRKIIIYFEIDFPNERSKKDYNTLLPLATDENNHFGGNKSNQFHA